MKTLSRALYDAVDFDIKGITRDKAHLRNIFYYHLVHVSNFTIRPLEMSTRASHSVNNFVFVNSAAMENITRPTFTKKE